MKEAKLALEAAREQHTEQEQQLERDFLAMACHEV